MEKQLKELESRAHQIEIILAPWRGLTLAEAQKRGFTPFHEKLQAELWSLGYKIISKHKEATK